MRKILPFIFLFICIGNWAFSQSCIPTNLNGSTIVISCNAPCSDIGFQVPHLKTTEDYIVNSIPYNAFAYTGGTVVSSIYIDDKFSPLITMGFPFCFYGQTYNDIVIGSNAVVTFEAICANAANAYTLDVGGVPQPIPYNSPASPAGIGTTYYPRASIMGVYQDIDPANSPLPTRRIEYRVEGTAPCRKFVISYKDIRMFSCNNLIATNQIVLYENTGVVEVYIQDKPVCPTWISGLGIIGVQDFTRTKAVAAPGKNCTAFSESNTGYRFTPSGTNSRYLSSELLDMGGAVIALADTATTVPGILDINFPNICPGPSVTQYVVRTRFSSCPVGPIMENLDTINVVRNNVLPVAVDSVPTTCNTNSGSITITPSAGVAPYTATATGPGGPYNYNGASPIVFSNLPAGMYSIYVSDNFGCDTSFNIEVTAITSLSQTVTSTNTSCAGANDGTITVTPTSGVAPFSATATGPGGPYTVAGPSPLVFTGLPAGTFNITFTDALGCTGNLIRTINQGVGLTAVPSRTNTTCFGGSNGSLTITPTVPGAYTFVLNPGGFTNTTGVFTGLVAGSYQCTFTNASGCSGTIVSLVVLSGPQLTGTHTFTNASCSGAPNGTITVTPTTPGSYTYFLNPGAITNTTGIFTGLIPGTYSVLATNSVGCTFVRSNIVINAGSSLSGTATSGTTTCPGATDGTITVTPATPGTYNYVLTPGGATSTTGTFTGLAPGTYSVLATNTVSGCTFNVSNINVINGTAPTGSATSGTTTCPGASNGTITVTPATPGTYTYVLNPGGATNTTGVFTGLATGTYTATGTNTVSGCIFTVNNINVTNGPALTGSATTNTTTCPGATDGTINVTPAIPGTYTYVLSPGAATNTTGIFTALTTGTYSVTANNAIGCSFTVNNINVTNGAVPVSTASSTATTCPTINNGSISVTEPGVAGTTLFTLNPGGISNTTGVFNGLAPGSYTVTFATAIGCTGTVTPNLINVVAGPTLSSAVAQTNPVCNNINDGVITITPQPGTTAPYFATLTGPGGPFTYNGPAPIVFNNLAPGIYSYSYSEAGGCAGTGGPVTLSSNPAINSLSTLVMPGCNGFTNGTITFNPTGGVAPYSYTSVNAGTAAGNVFSGLSANIVYLFTVTDAVGCTKDTSITLTEPNVLVASANSPVPSTCFGNDGKITVSATGGTTAYQYSINGTAFQSSPNFTAPNIGAYNVVVVKDAKGCKDTTNVTVVMIDTMRLSAGVDTVVCVRSAVTLQPQVNAIAPSAITWQWSSTNAPASTIANPSVQNAVVSPADTATYVVHAIWGLCERWDTLIVNVLHEPIANAGNDTAVCHRFTALLNGSHSNSSGPVIYTWTPNLYITDIHAPVTSVLLPDAGNYIYTLNVQDDYCCNFITNDAMQHIVTPPVPAFTVHDTIAVLGEQHQLYGSGGVQFTWLPAAPLNNAAAQNPLATLYNDTRFTLEVMDIAGCKGWDTVFIKVYAGPTYYVPTAFSPNGDGRNDIFRPIPSGIVKTNWFRVYNRFGNLLFETNEWLKGWDGRYRGRKQPIGAYVWMIQGVDNNGKIIEKKGTVILVE